MNEYTVTWGDLHYRQGGLASFIKSGIRGIIRDKKYYRLLIPTIETPLVTPPK